MVTKAEINKIFPANGEQNCRFILGAHNAKQFPQTYFPEFAFIGASNVGKSSLINALTSQKMAIVSNMPGRTRQVNFFLLAERLMLVDMPGYGFAKANDKHVENWQRTSLKYFADRPQLKRVFLLVDPVKGLKEADKDMANVFNSVAMNFQIVFTKIDRLKKPELNEALQKIKEQSKFWAALHPEIILTSSKTTEGIDKIKSEIVELL